MEASERTCTLEVCSSNQFLDDIETVDWLSQNYPDLSVEPADCLDRCGICMRYAYVLLNENFLYANSVSELKEKILHHLDSQGA